MDFNAAFELAKADVLKTNSQVSKSVSITLPFPENYITATLTPTDLNEIKDEITDEVFPAQADDEESAKQRGVNNFAFLPFPKPASKNYHLKWLWREGN